MQSESSAILTITQYMTFPREATQSAVEKVVVKIITAKEPNMMPVPKRVILSKKSICTREILRSKKEIIGGGNGVYTHF
tara:strand:+ start:380 stop:616 length:237 start_codon:yes stop_codon:yes gene_type:complete